MYYEADRDRYFLKRFLVEQELKEELIISESKGSELLVLLSNYRPVIRLEFVKPRGKDSLEDLTIIVDEFIGVKGIKALGNQVTTEKIKQVHIEASLPYEMEEQEPVQNEDTPNNQGMEDLKLF